MKRTVLFIDEALGLSEPESMHEHIYSRVLGRNPAQFELPKKCFLNRTLGRPR